ncbi:DNA methylase [Ahniella affigens]|uniref:Methyltransferase n=1 Tax=Ahniella affigens TaxID=2021234 RepID=A0A2P1PST0_9GAMM|nr:site-specific DNA-methyltransferase [Ahniella affigens]AVP97896.1 DNA methylase [Ahniella affigens]
MATLIRKTKRVRIGPVTLYRGDSSLLLPELGPFDAVVTDPPYSSGGMARSDRVASTSTKYVSSDAAKQYPDFLGDNRDQRSFVMWASVWLGHCLDITKPGGIACVFSDWRQIPAMSDALQVGGWVWRGVVPWDKLNARPQPNRFRAQCEYVLWATNGPRDTSTEGAEYHPGLLSAAPPATSCRVHAAQKPVSILRTLCKVAGSGGVVVDPFCGSGQTGIAAAAESQEAVLIEKCRESSR